MSSISALILKVLPSGTYELSSDLVYSMSVHPADIELWIIPAGFQTDLASVPRIFWTFFPPHGRYSSAAVIHDWLYVERPPWRVPPKKQTRVEIMRGIGNGDPRCYRPTTRYQADSAFLHIMRELGVSWWRRHVMWAAVRLGGWYGWRQRRAAEKQQ